MGGRHNKRKLTVWPNEDEAACKQESYFGEITSLFSCKAKSKKCVNSAFEGMVVYSRAKAQSTTPVAV